MKKSNFLPVTTCTSLCWFTMPPSELFLCHDGQALWDAILISKYTYAGGRSRRAAHAVAAKAQSAATRTAPGLLPALTAPLEVINSSIMLHKHQCSCRALTSCQLIVSRVLHCGNIAAGMLAQSLPKLLLACIPAEFVKTVCLPTGTGAIRVCGGGKKQGSSS